MRARCARPPAGVGSPRIATTSPRRHNRGHFHQVLHVLKLQTQSGQSGCQAARSLRCGARAHRRIGRHLRRPRGRHSRVFEARNRRVPRRGSAARRTASGVRAPGALGVEGILPSLAPRGAAGCRVLGRCNSAGSDGVAFLNGRTFWACSRGQDALAPKASPTIRSPFASWPRRGSVAEPCLLVACSGVNTHRPRVRRAGVAAAGDVDVGWFRTA